jgi:hypothetical protein
MSKARVKKIKEQYHITISIKFAVSVSLEENGDIVGFGKYLKFFARES